uniref:Uncharacterized protein n=1 Tax=Strigamia maritima TaxID=126957 RepID=T1IQB3_STRMM
MRNLAEKTRRDKLNKHISQLASIVPIVSTATKRVDKTSILRLSAAFLRINQNLLTEKSVIQWRPCFLQDGQLSNLLLDVSFKRFLIILSTSGKVIYVSDEIEKILGHSPVDIIGHSVYNIIHPDDYLVVQKNLQVTSDNVNERRSFYCHFSERTLSRSDCGKYDLVNVVGHARVADNRNENLLICVVRLIRNQPISEISWMDGYQNEYITQHSFDGRIICADHRISLLIGHMPEEVCGKNAYEYMYAKDIPVATLAHKDMFVSESGFGTAVYRLWTRTRSLVYLKSQGHMQQNHQLETKQTFLCINKLLSDEEGQNELHKLRMRFKPSFHEESSTGGVECIKPETTNEAMAVAVADVDVDDDKDTDSEDCLQLTNSSLKSLLLFLKSQVVTSSYHSKSPESSHGNGVSPASQTKEKRLQSADSWSQLSPDSMHMSGVTSTVSESHLLDYDGKNGDDDSEVSDCTLTATAQIMNVPSESQKTNSFELTSTSDSSDVSVPTLTSAAAIGRMRRVSRNVVRLPSYHSPSPGDVRMLLENAHRMHTEVNVPLKRRCSKVTSSEMGQPMVKRSRGRPRLVPR